MPDDIFISYSRRDQEFVTKLASDLNQEVAAVWFDQSDLAVGQKWHDQIQTGIQSCKVLILVLSPDSVNSPNVRDEVNQALALKKTIMPVLYRPTQLTGEVADLVHETQYLDLSQGSYADNFQKLLDGLVASGVAKQTVERPFLREPVKTDWQAVVKRIPGWGYAWGLGWALFWLAIIILLAILAAATGTFNSQNNAAIFTVITLGGGVGGILGGLLAGLITMISLRRYAANVSWKHMAPSIRIWVISGPLGLFLSLILAAVLSVNGRLANEMSLANCGGLSFQDCIAQGYGSAVSSALGTIMFELFITFLLAMGVWFLVGLWAGWQMVRHLRRLEPGIHPNETRLVMVGWGFGAVLGAFSSLIIFVLASLILRL